MKPPLTLTLHPEAPLKMRWCLWLAYIPGAIGEIVASGSCALIWAEFEPMRSAA